MTKESAPRGQGRILLGIIGMVAVVLIAHLYRLPVRSNHGAMLYPVRVIDAEDEALTVWWNHGDMAPRRLAAEYFPVDGARDNLRGGQRVFIGVSGDPDAPDEVFYAGRVREGQAIVMVALFLSIFVLVGGHQAPAGMIALLAAPAGTLLLVRLIAGGVAPPTATGVCAALLTLIMALLISGWRRRTTAIVIGAMCGLSVTAVLALVVSDWLLLTGVHSSFTQDLWHAARGAGTTLDLRALLRAGILLGAFGVVIDLATGVASAVFEVAEVNRTYSRGQLALAGLRVGRDVMSTEINTLVFAYVGAQIGLLLLPFYGPLGYTMPILQTLSLQDFATEAAFVTVGTAGLILTIPFTALVAGALAPQPEVAGARRARRTVPSIPVSTGWIGCVLAWTLVIWACLYVYRGTWHAYDDEGHAGAEARLIRTVAVAVDPAPDNRFAMAGEERVQQVAALILSGPERGQVLDLRNPISGFPGHDKIADRGRRLLVKTMNDGAGLTGAVIDYDRGPALILAVWALGLLVMLVGGLKGARALFALLLCAPVLGAGVFLVARFRLAALPVLAGVALALCIMVFTILSGPTRKSLAAAGGAFGGIACGGFVAAVVNRVMMFSGLQSHSLYAIRMFDHRGAHLDFQGLLAGGMLLGIVGVAMDVAIAVASSAAEIAEAGGAHPRELWKRGMNVGRNIMCTMVLALLFAYMGTNLALLQLPAFARHMPVRQALNSELFASEIVRITSGAIGVVIAIPAAAILSALLFGGVRMRSFSQLKNRFRHVRTGGMARRCYGPAILGVACWCGIAAHGSPAETGAAPAGLDLRGFTIQRDGDTWSGRFSYALVVGTFFEWNTDPTAIPGLFSELRRRTGIRPRVDFNTVTLSGRELFGNPFIMLTGDRFFRLSRTEVDNLRDYLLAGGALYADDCGGADHAFRHMLGQVFPDKELVAVPADHPVFTIFYPLAGVPKILDLYGTQAQGFGIFIGERLAVFYTYDTDIPCGWEKNPDGSFVHMLAPEKHEASIRLGVNVLLYFLSRAAGLDPGTFTQEQ